MKKITCIIFAILLLLSGCSSNHETASDAANSAYVTYQQLIDGTIKENDSFSIEANLDSSKTRIFDSDRMMHKALAYVGKEIIEFYYQTGSFESEEDAAIFNFDAIDALAGKKGVFRFSFYGLDKSTGQPIAQLQEVDVDGITYTPSEIGDITRINVFTEIVTTDTVIYSLPEYNEYVYAAARIENRGSVAAELYEYDCSLDIEDDNGNIVYHIDDVTIAPSVLMPGETGYIVGSDLNTKVTPEDCKKVVAHLSYDSAYAISRTLNIENITYSEYSGNFYSTPGTLVSTYEVNVEDVVPIIAFFNKDGKFIGVNICSRHEIVQGNSKLGFSGESADPIPLKAFTKEEIGSIIATGSYIIDLNEIT